MAEPQEGPGAKRERIYLGSRPATLRYLNQLVSLGLYGNDPTQAARRLVDEGIRLALREGLIRPEYDPPTPPPSANSLSTDATQDE